MPNYLVTWDINVEADTPLEAAQEALRIQRDPNSIATVMVVREMGGYGFSLGSGTEIEIDLDEEKES